MDKNQNEILSEEDVKTQNNFKSTKLSQNKINDQKYKTAKLFNHLPPLNHNRSTNDLRHGYNYALRETKLDFTNILNNEQPEYDSKILKNDLSIYKTDIYKKKKELSNLKIKYSKLLGDNVNNKAIIANILAIPLHNYITKSTFVEKVENCELTDKDRKILEEAYKILTLKLEISEKKKKIEEQNKYIEELRNNSKTKIINEYQNNYYTKCEQQRSLLDTLQKLEEKYDFYEKKNK